MLQPTKTPQALALSIPTSDEVGMRENLTRTLNYGLLDTRLFSPLSYWSFLNQFCKR